jgi:exopolysaccharide biosynthesis polyprenyl glycosylphosphotransferase
MTTMQRVARYLLIGGTAAAVVGIGLAHAEIHDEVYFRSFRLWWALAYIVLLCGAAYAIGFPDLVRTRQAPLAALGATAAAAVGMSLIQLVAGTALLPRFVVFTVALALIPWYVLCAAIASKGRADAEDRDRVVVVGDTSEAQSIRDELAATPERHANVVGSLTAVEAASVDAGRHPLEAEVTRTGASLVVLAQSAQAEERVVAQAADLHAVGVRIRTLTGFCSEWLGKLPLTELERASLLFDIGDVHRATYARLKRIFDLTLAFFGLILLAVSIPFVLVGDVIANRGPLLFRQPRVGRNGETFQILKFRTMRTDASGEGDWTVEDDPRLTPFGRILRRLHVDELPQMVNILRGELSVVGPRPEQPRYVEELTEKIPFYEFRHLVRPGLTGWAQVKFEYGATDSDALEKLQYDFFYLQNQSVSLDLRVLRRTIRHVFGMGGR